MKNRQFDSLVWGSLTLAPIKPRNPLKVTRPFFPRERAGSGHETNRSQHYKIQHCKITSCLPLTHSLAQILCKQRNMISPSCTSSDYIVY